MKKLICAALLAAASTSALAVPFVETDDAGNTMATAAVVTAGATSINGRLSVEEDADLYRFVITTAGTYRFYGDADYFNDDVDANLLLFNEFGQGLAGSDDEGEIGDPDFSDPSYYDSLIEIALEVGTYYIGFGGNNTEAYVDEAAAAEFDYFFSNDDGVLDAPTAEQLGLIASDDDALGAYTISISAVETPEPAALALLGMGVIGIAAARRRRA